MTRHKRGLFNVLNWAKGALVWAVVIGLVFGVVELL